MAQMTEFLKVGEAKEAINIGLREWVGQLREISCDVEDVLDKYMLRFGQHGGVYGFRGYIKKTYGCLKNLNAFEIQDIKYGVEVICVVGMGGLGKNTLVKKVYDLKALGIEEYIYGGSCSSHELNEGGSGLVSLSYYDLPHHLKYFFLYLSVYLESDVLYKLQNLRFCSAEGFVLWRQGRTTEEVADDYLNELVSPSLIQVAERAADGEIIGVRIHDLIREYITLRSRERNIMTV